MKQPKFIPGTVKEDNPQTDVAKFGPGYGIEVNPQPIEEEPDLRELFNVVDGPLK